MGPPFITINFSAKSAFFQLRLFLSFLINYTQGQQKMIVDFHTHIFPDKIAEKAIQTMQQNTGFPIDIIPTESELIKNMKESGADDGLGIDVSILLPVCTNPEKCWSLNEFARSINEKYASVQAGSGEKKLISFGAIHPAMGDLRNAIYRIKEMGFKGIKLHPDNQNTFFDDENYIKIIEYAEENGLITVVHSGFDGTDFHEIRCTPFRILNVLKRIQPERLIMAHMGANFMWYDAEQTICGKGLYFDTAFVNKRIETQQFIRLMEKNGPEKILFGTDSPWDNQKEDLDYIKNLPINEGDRKMILGENAAKLLGL